MEKRKRGGQPGNTNNLKVEGKKEAYIHVKCEPEEKNLIVAHTQKIGRVFSSWVREACAEKIEREKS